MPGPLGFFTIDTGLPGLLTLLVKHAAELPPWQEGHTGMHTAQLLVRASENDMRISRVLIMVLALVCNRACVSCLTRPQGCSHAVLAAMQIPLCGARRRLAWRWRT